MERFHELVAQWHLEADAWEQEAVSTNSPLHRAVYKADAARARMKAEELAFAVRAFEKEQYLVEAVPGFAEMV